MDDQQRAVWREVRDAADANALAIWLGEDDPFAELEMLLALHNQGQLPGFRALARFHEQRSGQYVQDGQWSEAHHVAADHYRQKACEAEAEILQLADAAAAATDDGQAIADRIASLVTVLGDAERDGAVVRAWREMHLLGLTAGSRVLAGSLLAIEETYLELAEGVLFRGLITEEEATRWSQPFARYVEYLYATSCTAGDAIAVTRRLAVMIRAAELRDKGGVDLLWSVLDYWDVRIPEDAREALGR